MTDRAVRRFAEITNGAEDALDDADAQKKRTSFRQAVSNKEIQDGDSVATCGHVEPGGMAYTFDGFWKHEETEICFLACCEACAARAKYDLLDVVIVDVVTFGEAAS